MLNFSGYDLVRMGFDCKSAEERLPTEEKVCSYLYVSDCAKDCYERNGCNYFTFGYDLRLMSNRALCFWKKTESVNCTEGWEENEYNFFEIISMLD